MQSLHRWNSSSPGISLDNWYLRRCHARSLTLFIPDCRNNSPYADFVAAQDMFIFRVEGTGVLKAEDVVITALDILHRKLYTLQTSLPEQDDVAPLPGAQ